MSSSGQETKQDGVFIPIKEKWDYSPRIDGKTNYCHVTRIDEQELITDFLLRKSEGALLISGRRGVGKTSAVFAAIQEADRFLENKNKENKKEKKEETQMEMFAILVNAPNFEIRKIKPEQKNNISEQIDFLEFKRIILQNLVRRLYEVAVKKEIIPIADERVLDQSKMNILKIFSRKKGHISREENTPQARLNEHQQNDLDDIKKKISNLFRRTVAKEVRSETSLKELEQERYHLQKERSLELTGNIFGATIAVSSFIAVAVAIFPLTGIEVLNRILPAVIGIVPPAVISWKVKRTTEDQTEAERKASTYYLYDYDLSTLQSELEETLLKLKENSYKKYKVVFVIDELDKVDENDVIEVIKSLKTLFNQGSALFVLVTGNEFYNSLLERSKARGKEYTLFPQRIFLMRPQSEEITKFMDKIVDMDNNPQQQGLELLFDFDDNKIPNDQSKIVKLEEFSQSKRVYKSDVHKIEETKITREHDDGSISITFGESSINLKRDNELPTSTLVDKDNNKYDFSVLKKDGKYQVYVRANRFRIFQNYALYKARSDFFDLYNVLRDRIVYSDSKLELKINLDKKQEMQANLQEILGINYSKQAYSELSDWHKNEQLLDLMYELIITLGERIGNAKIVRVEKTPKFSIVFFNDKNEKISQIPVEKGKKGLGEWFTETANEDNTLTDVEKNALTALVETIIKNKFLNVIEITSQYEKYEVTGILEGTTETLSPAEKAFLDEYKWLLNILLRYVDVYIAHTQDKTAEALFNRAKTEQDLKSILDIELIKEVTSTSMLLSNKDDFNTTYAGLRSVQKVRFPREELEEKTKIVRDTRNEVMRNFVLLLKNIINYNKEVSIYSDGLSAERFTVMDLQEKLGTKFTLTSNDATERTLDIPNLLIEYDIKTERRQLLVIQNPPSGVREEIQKINKNELYALFLATNSAVIEDVQKSGERTGGKSDVFQQEDVAVWENRFLELQIPGTDGSFSNAVDTVISWIVAKQSYEEGMAALESKNYDGASELFEKSLKSDRANPHAYYNKGVILLSVGKYDEAINTFERVLALDAGYVDAWYEKARCKVKKNDVRGALTDLKKTIQTARDYYKDPARYAKLALEEKDFESLRNEEEFREITGLKASTGSVANTLNDVINYLQTNPKGRDFFDYYYVQRGDTKKILAELNQSIFHREHAKIFLIGQRGGGVTTELRKLAFDLEVEKNNDMLVFFMSVIDNVEPLTISFADIIFSITRGLVKSMVELSTPFEENVVSKLERWLVIAGRSQTNQDMGGKEELSLVNQFINNTDPAKEYDEDKVRQLVRLAIEIFNDIIDSIRISRQKNVIMLIDDLDKVLDFENNDFIDNIRYLDRLKCRLILNAPSFVIHSKIFISNMRSLRFDFYPLPIFNVRNFDGSENPDGIKMMREIARRRISGILMPDQVVERAAKYSGGVVAQFLELLRDCSTKASVMNLTSVNPNILNEVVRDETSRLGAMLDKKYLDKLVSVHERKFTISEIANDSDFLSLLSQGTILEYRDNDRRWVEVHPLVARLMKDDLGIL